ncbi:hypothetical protein BRADI_3g52035v3 [Brachypodium distachyon]|uniref:Uncharacterized protein n=1 Tax=Brachypodium distachyon TaxID=15368 RepID=A0A2K2D4P4_BRADI|nr:hypothetical protein BRADI_3g52035v3 [Brachypodium distachyon]
MALSVVTAKLTPSCMIHCRGEENKLKPARLKGRGGGQKLARRLSARKVDATMHQVTGTSGTKMAAFDSF